MRQSQLFTKTQKNAPKDEVSLNAQLLIRGGFVDKLSAGIYTLLPLGLRVIKKIENIIREEINSIGGQEIFMPSLHPKENWEITNRWKSLDEDMYKTKDSSDKEFVLAPTHEEVIIPLAKKFINSYKDLPFSAYQFQNKFRKEKRAKSGILRGREFIMKDLYSFHLTEEDLNSYYEKVDKAYLKIFERAGIGEKTYKTFASGGTFSKYSHEYQTLTQAGEDVIYICEKCHTAVNKEIIADVENKCPECGEKLSKTEKAVEVGNIFKNKDKYTLPFKVTAKNEKGEDILLLTGCYGIGLQRLMGTIVEVFNDEKGIVWPEAVAPFKVHLISLSQNEEAQKIYDDLEKNNIEVLFDDREISAGEKFADSDLIGIPYRIVISKKSLENGGAEIKKRNEKESRIIKIEDITRKLK
ncbi:MAG: prolyl-tRNA synthetase [Candidatus Moranbacteria bacterium CG23_combo_of_CG06-09_8_20_14_all_35_22]|nr:MAG: prolyl-tRNA synthetase [Candidatus Moranbacteria bacterium CG23_combo_of_CG06-09_8_20_14_all_35_22]